MLVSYALGESLPEEVRGSIIAVGNFDGVHRGHAALVSQARSLDPSRSVAAVTFDPHPLALLAPERFQPPLTTLQTRARNLHEVGAAHVIALRTVPELLLLSPREFFETIVLSSLRARGMVEGFNFRFGRDRVGTNDMLRSWCAGAGIPFREVQAFELDGKPVSSSRVRDALLQGRIEQAAELLGRNYSVEGIVRTGARRGRTIGFPTANLAEIATLLPAEGVYAVRVHRSSGIHPGAANIGPNPTFGESAAKFEVHLMDFSGDLYDQPLRVEFLARLRGTQQFAGIEELKAQLERDMLAVRERVRPSR